MKESKRNQHALGNSWEDASGPITAAYISYLHILVLSSFFRFNSIIAVLVAPENQ